MKHTYFHPSLLFISGCSAEIVGGPIEAELDRLIMKVFVYVVPPRSSAAPLKPYYGRGAYHALRSCSAEIVGGPIEA